MSFLFKDLKTLKKLKGEIATSNLFFLGETHGVEQNIKLLEELYRKFDFECLALEWFDVLAKSLMSDLKNNNDFSLTKKERAFNILCEDGRASLHHLQMLSKLFNLDVLKKVILYGHTKTAKDWNTRENNYLKNFMTGYTRKYKTLIVGGNLHAKTTVFEATFEKGTLKPFAFLLKEKLGYFPTGKINYLSGEYYNIGIKKFNKDKNLGQINKYSRTENVYSLIVEEATALIPPA